MESESLEFKGLKRRPQTTYVKGSAAPKTKPGHVEKKLTVVPGKSSVTGILEKVGLTAFYILCISMFLGVILVYINLQGSISQSVTKIADIREEYETEKRNNDESMADINNSIDNEEIRRIAIEELGMHYAAEGQIVSYNDEYVNDYVRTYAVIR